MMKAWFEQFDQREQLALLILALAVGVFVLYRGLYQPLDNRRDARVLENQRLLTVLSEVDTTASRIVSAQASASQKGGNRNLTRLINQTTANRQLQVSRLQPNGRGDIQVRLENMPFDKVIDWLHHLEKGEGLLISEVSLTQGNAAGMVNVSVRVAQGG